MIRQPAATRDRVLRWLLILTALAGLGLGLGPGAPAPDPMAAAPVGQQIDECHAVRVAPANAVVSVRLPPSAGIRTQPVTAAPQPVPARTVPAVTPATIGVCRT